MRYDFHKKITLFVFWLVTYLLSWPLILKPHDTLISIKQKKEKAKEKANLYYWFSVIYLFNGISTYELFKAEIWYK